MRTVVKSKSAFFLGSLLSLILCSCKADVGNSVSSKIFNPPSTSSIPPNSSVSGSAATSTYTILPAAVIVGRVKPAEVAMVEPQEETYRGLAD